MDEDFVNQYIQRLLKEVDYLNRDRLLKETRVSILEGFQEKNKTEIENSKAEVEAANGLRDQALSSLEKLTVDYKNLEASKDKEIKNLYDMKQGYMDEIAKLNDTINNLNKNVADEKNKSANLDREIARQVEELDKMFKELSELRAKAVDTAQTQKKTSRKGADDTF